MSRVSATSSLLRMPLVMVAASPSPAPILRSSCPAGVQHRRRRHATHAVQEAEDKQTAEAEKVTEKYGLEAGLWKIFRSEEKEGKSKADEAKELLAKYGGAYLATSITLSAISFSLCYLLVSVGVDVSALLAKIGIATDATGEKVGALALAYAAHKAASPIRFPPTVALTPIVAGWLGKLRKDDGRR